MALLGGPILRPFWPGAAQKGLDLKPVRLDGPPVLAQGLLRRGLNRASGGAYLGALLARGCSEGPRFEACQAGEASWAGPVAAQEGLLGRPK